MLELGFGSYFKQETWKLGTRDFEIAQRNVQIAQIDKWRATLLTNIMAIYFTL